jgi:hypothetical protein
LQLKRAVDALQPELGNRIAFVLADLSTAEGQAFARMYGAGETTLVFLDPAGRAINMYRGVTTEAHLRSMIRTTFGF